MQLVQDISTASDLLDDARHLATNWHSRACAFTGGADETSASRADKWWQPEQVKRGWVWLQDFALVFIIIPERNLKKATQKLLQRLRKRNCEVADDEEDTFGRPPKVARTRDLQSVWPSD